MKSVKIKKSELLSIVRKNKESHILQFSEASEDFIKGALRVAKENLQLAETGDLESISKFKMLPQKPVSYENSYARAIRMLELSIDDVIEVEEDIFNQLVLDEWSWKHAFTASGMTYKSL